MPLVADRVSDQGTVSGTGAITLAGNPPTGYQAFGTAFQLGSSVYYAASDAAGNWEVGFGTLVTATTLSRDTVTASSASNGRVTFPASSAVTVFCTAPADVIQDAGLGRQLALRNNLPLF